LKNVFQVTDSSHLSGWSLIAILLATCLAAMLACAILGVVIERIAYRPLRNAPRLAPLISAIGVSLILEDIGKLWKGINFVSFPQIFPQVNYNFASVTVTSVNLLVIAVSVVLMLGLQYLI